MTAYGVLIRTVVSDHRMLRLFVTVGNVNSYFILMNGDHIKRNDCFWCVDDNAI